MNDDDSTPAAKGSTVNGEPAVSAEPAPAADAPRSFFTGRRDQMEEILLDVAIVVLFAAVFWEVQSLARLSQWFPKFIVYIGGVVIIIKLIADLMKLRKPPEVMDKGNRFM